MLFGPDPNIKITYEAIVKGLDRIQQLAQENAKLEQQTNSMREKIRLLEESHTRHENALEKARRAILNFRKELFAITFTAASVTAVLAGLAKTSEALGAQLEGVGGAFRSIGNSIGNMIAQTGALNGFTFQVQKLAEILERLSQRVAGGKKSGAVTSETASFIESLQAKTLSLQGNTRLSQELQLDVEFLQKIQPLLEKTKGTIAQDQLAQAWRNYRKEAEEALRRSELGIKNNIEIAKDFARTIAGAFETGVSEPIYKLLQGERQTPMDVLKGFTSGINRAVADAIGSAFKASIFGGGGGNFFQNLIDSFRGGNPTEKAVRESGKATERKLDMVNNSIAKMMVCVCSTAENTGFMAANVDRMGARGMSFEGLITPPSKGWLDKIGAIAGGIGSIGSAAAGLGGLGSLGSMGSMGASASNFPSIDWSGYQAAGVGHTGGWVDRAKRFNSGGEVPAFVEPGEYVVRKPMAQDNKDLLKDINMGRARRSRGATNVFLIRTNDAQSFTNMLSSPAAQEQIEMNVIRKIMSNGNLRKVIQDFAK